MEKAGDKKSGDDYEGAAIKLQAAFRGRRSRKDLHKQQSEEKTKSMIIKTS